MNVEYSFHILFYFYNFIRIENKKKLYQDNELRRNGNRKTNRDKANTDNCPNTSTTVPSHKASYDFHTKFFPMETQANNVWYTREKTPLRENLTIVYPFDRWLKRIESSPTQ